RWPTEVTLTFAVTNGPRNGAKEREAYDHGTDIGLIRFPSDLPSQHPRYIQSTSEMDSIAEIAAVWGLEADFRDAFGKIRTVEPAVLARLLEAFPEGGKAREKIGRAH